MSEYKYKPPPVDSTPTFYIATETPVHKTASPDVRMGFKHHSGEEDKELRNLKKGAITWLNKRTSSLPFSFHLENNRYGLNFDPDRFERYVYSPKISSDLDKQIVQLKVVKPLRNSTGIVDHLAHIQPGSTTWVDRFTYFTGKENIRKDPGYVFIEENRYGINFLAECFELVESEISGFRFKTKGEFIDSNLWDYDSDSPERWNDQGQMDKYVGANIPAKYIHDCQNQQGFNMHSWAFGKDSYVKVSELVTDIYSKDTEERLSEYPMTEQEAFKSISSDLSLPTAEGRPCQVELTPMKNLTI